MRRQEDLSIQLRERHIFAWSREREWIASRHAPPRVGKLVRSASIGDLGAERRILRHHAVGNEGADGVVKERSTYTERGLAFAIRIVDEAQARREVREP